MSWFDSLQMCKYRLTTWTVQLSFEVSSVEYISMWPCQTTSITALRMIATRKFQSWKSSNMVCMINVSGPCTSLDLYSHADSHDNYGVWCFANVRNCLQAIARSRGHTWLLHCTGVHVNSTRLVRSRPARFKEFN